LLGAAMEVVEAEAPKLLAWDPAKVKHASITTGRPQW
jgi:hypothetical protein